MIDFNERFVYDETSPSCLRWKIDRYTGGKYQILRRAKGDIAGYINPATGYWDVSIGNKKFLKMHRIIWEMMNGAIPDGFVVDHIDGDKTNNGISNLRVVTAAHNTRNRIKAKTNTSGVTGVYLEEKANRFKAMWCDLHHIQRSKSFSINKYGYEEAFNLACEWREKKIAELNLEGAGYTERHGKDYK